MALDQTRANEVLTWMHGGSAPTALTLGAGMRLKLLTAIGTATANGTELAAGGSYAQVSGNAGGVLTAWAAASGGSQATNAVAQQTNMPAATITSIEVWDSAATNKRVEFGTLASSKTTASGDTLSFASGAITSALA